jgi:hypothetical protein
MLSEDLDGKIEKAMPTEDADQTPKTEPTTVAQGPSFVKDPAKSQQPQEKRQITTLDVLMYMGKQLKEIKEVTQANRDLLEKLLNQSKMSVIAGAQPSIQPTSVTPTVSSQPPAPVQQTISAPEDAGLIKVKDALAEFLKDGSLTINGTENTMFYIIKSTKFLGTDNFAKIASIVRGLGGEYVSQGKASHFKVPKGSK